NISVEALAVSGTNLFAGCNGSIFFSANNGTNWTEVNTGLPSGNQCQRLAVSGANFFVGTGSGVWKRPLSEFGSSGVARNNAEPVAIELSPNPTKGIVKISGISEGSDIELMNVLGES